ncbi:hypothetical protein ACFQZ4_17265 [Catellatospora coxensis]
MRSAEHRATYRASGTALVRAAAHIGLELPAYPDVTDPAASDCATSWVEWLRAVWALPEVAETLRHASPVLARQIVVLISAGKPRCAMHTVRCCP